jgi:hypothetical protein
MYNMLYVSIWVLSKVFEGVEGEELLLVWLRIVVHGRGTRDRGRNSLDNTVKRAIDVGLHILIMIQRKFLSHTNRNNKERRVIRNN